MKFKKLAATILAASMIASMGICANAEIMDANLDAPNTEVTDETLKIAFANEPATIWGAPAGQVENEAQYIAGALMDSLVKVDKETGEILPSLATSWEWVDGTHCKFTLRDDVTMSDGTPLVADDVVYTVGIWTEYSANTDTGRFVKGAVADDEHTVTIEYALEAPDLLTFMSFTNFGIVSEDEVNAAGGPEAAVTNPVMGSGKYRFVSWERGQSITLERNDNYWDPDYKGYFKTIQITFTNDAAAREMAVESGDAQVALDMPVIQAATYAGSDSVNVIAFTFGQNTHLWFNMTDGHATADIKVRQAIMKALNYEALAQVGTAGTAPMAVGYAPAGSLYANETYTAEEKAMDIDGAKALLEEAGYGDGLDLSILGTQDSVPVYTVIQENLRAIGINVTINTPDVAQFVGDANGGNYDLISVGDYIENRNPGILPFVSQASIDTFVIGGPKVTTPEMDGLVQEIIAEQDQTAAKEKLAELEQIFKDDAIEMDLYPEMKAAVIAKDIKGFRTLERGFNDITSLYK